MLNLSPVVQRYQHRQARHSQFHQSFSRRLPNPSWIFFQICRSNFCVDVIVVFSCTAVHFSWRHLNLDGVFHTGLFFFFVGAISPRNIDSEADQLRNDSPDHLKALFWLPPHPMRDFARVCQALQNRTYPQVMVTFLIRENPNLLSSLCSKQPLSKACLFIATASSTASAKRVPFSKQFLGSSWLHVRSGTNSYHGTSGSNTPAAAETRICLEFLESWFWNKSSNLAIIIQSELNSSRKAGVTEASSGLWSALKCRMFIYLDRFRAWPLHSSRDNASLSWLAGPECPQHYGGLLQFWCRGDDFD